jgi:hypothetical protein
VMSTVAFSDAYATALARHVAAPDEESLHAAYELGRDAVADELGILELATAHHDALRRAAASGVEVDSLLAAAADFFLEAASAYEMVGRGFREARAAALAERRHAAMIRRLSSFLADASLVTSPASLREVATLLAEHARELTEARCCAVESARAGGAPVLAVSALDDGCAEALAAVPTQQAATLLDNGGLPIRLPPERVAEHAVLRRLASAAEAYPGWLGVPITGLDGRQLGFVQLVAEPGRGVVVHLAEMVGATLERMTLYGA